MNNLLTYKIIKKKMNINDIINIFVKNNNI